MATVPSPKSPPKYPDFCGKHRLQVEVQILNREIGFLEEELQSLDDLQPASKCCKGLNDFAGARPDPLIPINRGKSEPCCVSWSWFWKKICAGLSRMCCCGSSSASKPKNQKPKCPCSCSCCSCFSYSPLKNCLTCPSCSFPKLSCCPFPLSCQPCSGDWPCRRRRLPCRCPAYSCSCSCSCPNCFRCSKTCCLFCCMCP